MWLNVYCETIKKTVRAGQSGGEEEGKGGEKVIVVKRGYLRARALYIHITIKVNVKSVRVIERYER